MLSTMDIFQRSLLMAKLSNLAYNDDQSFVDLGYDSVFLNKDTAQAYFLWNKKHIIIVCRGTQATDFRDIKTDLELQLVMSSSNHGKVHKGFKHSVDLIWDQLNSLLNKYGKNRQVWCTGHSLGAAMATLIATRCHRMEGIPNPILFTFGSPRVGDSEYVAFMETLGIEHHRWVNNADIVTRHPKCHYKHHGTLHYFNHYGNLDKLNWFTATIDRIRGFIVGIRKGKINYFVNHFITNYIKNLEDLQ